MSSGRTPAKPAVLLAYQAVPQTVQGVSALKELWESSSISGNFGPGAVKFTVPTIANALVFVVRRRLRLRTGTAGSDRRELHGDLPCDCHYASLPRDVVGARATH